MTAVDCVLFGESRCSETAFSLLVRAAGTYKASAYFFAPTTADALVQIPQLNSTTRRQPVIFFCAVNQGVFSALMVINSFPSERALSLRERAAGTYKASAYFLAKTTADALVQIPQPIVFSIIVYFLVGFQDVGSKFIIFTLFMIFCSLSATSLALMVSALCKTTDFAVTVLPLTLEIGRLFGGFFLAPALLPKYFEWLDALSYIKYTVS